MATDRQRCVVCQRYILSQREVCERVQCILIVRELAKSRRYQVARQGTQGK